MKLIKRNGRKFLAESPYLNAMSWETTIRKADEFLTPYHFYGKFTLMWDGIKMGIHSWAEHGNEGADKFIDKCIEVISAIEDFSEAVEENKPNVASVILNGAETPYSGSVYWHYGNTPSGIEVCIFEFASCKVKVRIHAKDVGGKKKLLKILSIVHKQLDKLIRASQEVEKELHRLNNYVKPS